MSRFLQLMTLSTLSVLCTWTIYQPRTQQILEDSSLQLLDRELQKVFGIEHDLKMLRSRRQASTSKKPIVPQFMMDLANQDTTRHSTAQSDDFIFNGNIRSYHPKYLDTSGSLNSQTDIQHRHLYFTAPKLPPRELLASAELKIFATSADLEDDYIDFLIQIFNIRISFNESGESSPCTILHDQSTETDKFLDLITSKTVKSTDHSQWHSFNITSHVSDWMKSPILNCGLHVSIIPLSQPNNQNRNFTKSQVKLKLSLDDEKMTDDWLKDHEPLLIVKSHDQRTNQTQRRSAEVGSNSSTEVGSDGRKPTNTSNGSVKRARRSLGPGSTPNSRGDRSRLDTFQQKHCDRYLFYIDFNQIGWVDWVLAPPGFQAYICVGSCPFPVTNHLNTTNHGIVQTLVNSLNPHVVGPACCVPTELSSISLLFLDHNNTPVLRAYKDMVVQACGCR